MGASTRGEVTTVRKLIEVALPLDAINKAAAREKSIRHGHPSTLHLWWARRPLAAARAVLFAQMVDDPSGYVDVLLSDAAKRRAAQRELKRRGGGADDGQALREIAAEQERERLFEILRELVRWENTTNEKVLERARTEIWQSWRRACAENADHPLAAELFDRHRLPAFYDPFAGGGAIPLEAQRLGMEAHASDLNPVAVLITKAMIEIPPRFAGRPPVQPSGGKNLTTQGWQGAAGLAEDIRYYGQWMRDEAERRIGHLYPKVEITREMVRERPDLKRYEGRKLTVIAWLWARTVKSSNPAFADVDVPLASTFMLSTKRGKEAYVEPVIEGRDYFFSVRAGVPPDPAAAKNGTKVSRGSFRCLFSNTPIKYEYIDDEANAGRMGERLMAIVAAGDRARVYLPPSQAAEAIAHGAKPSWKPDAPSRGTWASNAQGRRYGFQTFGDYFTPRQLAALTTFSDLAGEAMERIRHDAVAADLPDDGRSLRDGGTGATAYAEAVGVYLGFALSKQADLGNSLCRWEPVAQCPRQLFGRQAIPMVWDFAEGNPLGQSSGSWEVLVNGIARAFTKTFGKSSPNCHGLASQADARVQRLSDVKIVSTDPPYYDNIGYAELSDFFYVWLRRSLKPVFPGLFATVAVPKAEELVASAYRHGGKEAAEAFFLAGMTQAMHRLATQAHAGFPVTIYYAFKQSETSTGTGTVSTGWETFLDAVLRSGLSITGTWPMRTENASRMVGQGTNALASSIVLACRPRRAEASTATRREFLTALRAELPPALRVLQTGNVAPVDLAQAAIGPGMAIYTRYAKVLDAAGKPVSVRDALALINRTLDEVLADQEGDFDADSRWAVAWFEQHGFATGDYGVAETLSKAKNTSVEGMVEAGILASKGGKVRLLNPRELPEDWDPATDTRRPVWEVVHHLIRALDSEGEKGAARLLARVGADAEAARELCYRLYTLCERKKRAAEARDYNTLVQSWPEIMQLSLRFRQPSLLGDRP